jgi:hypothetical protein
MKALLVFAIFDGIALVLATLWLWNAPQGYEDEDGFHVTGPSRWEQLRARFIVGPVRTGPAAVRSLSDSGS